MILPRTRINVEYLLFPLYLGCTSLLHFSGISLVQGMGCGVELLGDLQEQFLCHHHKVTDNE